MYNVTLLSFLILPLLGGLTAPSYGQDLIVNEIFFAPEDSELEFIELLNHSSNDLNACAYSFSDNRNDITPICDGILEIRPGAYLVLARNSELLTTLFGGISTVTPSDWPALNNSGDSVRLYRGNSLIEEVPYISSWGVRGYSIERIDPNGPSWAAINWRPSQARSKATPGAENSVFFPDRIPPAIRLAEVQNSTSVFVVLDEPAEATSLSRDQFRIVQSTPQTIEILTDTTFLLHFAIPFSGSTLISRELRDFSGNQSATRSTSLSYLPQPGDLVINEIMYQPLANAFDALPDQPEYIELYNASNRLLSLRTVSITGPENERGQTDTLRATPKFPTLTSKQYALFYDRGYGGMLTEVFPSLAHSTPVLLPIPSSTLGLSNVGDLIRINNAQNERIDEVYYSPSWHYPELTITTGISLERRTPDAASSATSNWSSSVDPEGGTPGRKNSTYIDPHLRPTSAQVDVLPIPFTPNGDGIDDVLTIRVRASFAPQSIRIRMYDAKGRSIHSLAPASLIGSESLFIWDGYVAGVLMRTGLYILLIEIVDIVNGATQTIKKVAVLAR